mmetsp:Transcript_34251/g.65424  ORF Transcript_34251/g.65424 Transcript_34251/m.65424 type:complete len:361 (-) Transcript_34251:207-1289(-)
MACSSGQSFRLVRVPSGQHVNSTPLASQRKLPSYSRTTVSQQNHAAPQRQRASRIVREKSLRCEGSTGGYSQGVHVPKSIHDVDNGKILGFGADLAKEHPGFLDEAYKRRRMDIVSLAKSHTFGEPIPRVEYSSSEVTAWGTALRELKALYPTHACKEFLRNWDLFEFREDVVPQLQDVHDIIHAQTGWNIRPVAGLMHPRDFLNGLAFETFHSTQYVRHESQPMYTPEPDVIHELLGHVVMLTDPNYCHLVKCIGEASLGATEKEIWHLTKVYWYTVEFGVVKEGDSIKAFGAGILSSYGELEHMIDGSPILEPFDPSMAQPKMSYKDGFQKRYFVMDSFEQGCRLLEEFSAGLVRARK